jgi:tRNA G46 methylase TrmB
MAKVSFARGLAAALGAVSDGQMTYATDTKKLYMDASGARNLLNPNADWNAASGNAKIENKPFTVVKSQDSTTGEDVFDITFI